jgi:hypothetical protein
MRRILLTIAFGSMASCSATSLMAASLTELQKYDLNRNGFLDPGREQQLYLTHLGNPVLRTFDTNPLDGMLEPNEVRAIEAAESPKLPSGLTETELDEVRADLYGRGPIRLAKLADAPAPREKKEKREQRWFLRKNRLDISVYNDSFSASAAEGASINATWDGIEDETSLNIQGILTYVLLRNTDPTKDIEGHSGYLAGYALAPWVEVNQVGNVTTDEFTQDKLAFGLAGQLEYTGGPFFGNQVLTFKPYYQTDRDFEAEIYGGTATWEPYNTSLGIGLGERTILFHGLDYTLQVHADVDYMDVVNPGLTGLTAGTEFVWLGGGVKPTFWILPSMFEDRLYAVVHPTWYYDAVSGEDAFLFNSTLNYNLGEKGFTAISVSYQNGLDRSIGEDTEAIEAGLKVKY